MPFRATRIRFDILDFSTFRLYYKDAHLDMLRWLLDHGIDPKEVLVNKRIVRDEENYCVIYFSPRRNEKGRFIRTPDGLEIETVEMREQGEGPPLPFPKSIFDPEKELKE